MRPTWVFTVASDRNSSPAISVFDRPWATSGAPRAPARSARPARRHHAGRPPDVPANRSISRRVMRRRDHGVAAGDRADRGHQLGRRGVLEQEAAGAGAQRGEGVLVQVERGQDEHLGRAGAGHDPPGRLDAVQPGIRTSISTTSGRRPRQLDRPPPSPASPTTSMSGCAPSTIRKPMRSSSWSSTSSTRIPVRVDSQSVGPPSGALTGRSPAPASRRRVPGLRSGCRRGRWRVPACRSARCRRTPRRSRGSRRAPDRCRRSPPRPGRRPVRPGPWRRHRCRRA